MPLFNHAARCISFNVCCEIYIHDYSYSSYTINQESEFHHQNIFVAGCIDENKMTIYFHMHTNLNFGKSISSMMLATKISCVKILFFYNEIYSNGISLYIPKAVKEAKM